MECCQFNSRSSLDGGQLLRIVLEGFFDVKGLRISLLIGLIISLLAAIIFFLMQGFIVGALFLLFAYQSFEMYKQSEYISSADRKETIFQKLEEGEKTLQQGRKEEAKAIFESLRTSTKKGIVFASATYHLAKMAFQENDLDHAYQLLLSIEKQLPTDAIPFFHELAFLQKDYAKVAAFASECFNQTPTFEVALRNAKAYAGLKQGHYSGGWLSTAVKKGKLDLEKILTDDIFDLVKTDLEFKRFFDEK